MATYYCDYKSGNNTNDGATGTPWKTITYALTQMANSDTLLLRGDSADVDTYYREDDLTCALNSVTIQNDTGHTPVWVATTRLTTWVATGGTVNVYEAAFAGIAQTGCANGTTVLAPATDVANCDATTDSFYMDNVGGKLYVNIGGGAPTAIEASDAVKFLLQTSGSGIVVDGIICQWMLPVFYVNGTTCTIRNCTTRYQLRERTATHLIFRVSKDDCTIQDCTLTQPSTRACTNTIEIGVVGTANRCTIDGCTFSGSSYASSSETINIQAGTGHVISDCVLDDFRTGILIKGADTSVTLSGNTITDWTLYAAYVQAGDVILSRNRFYLQDAGGGKAAIRVTGNPALSVYHNVFHRLDHTGSNNGRAFDIYPTADGMAVTAKNNVVYGSRWGITYDGGGGYAEPTWALDYNGFYSITTASFVNIAVGDQGTHNVTADPLFTDVAGYDYTLTVSSPYRNTGVAIAGINDGTGGSTRFGGVAPDIGYWEYPDPILATGGGMLLLGVG